MCGIAAIISGHDADTDRANIGAMLDAIAHRGPDGQDIWQGDGVTIGHCRLAILDTSARAAQPMVTADETGVLTYNGEVYNAADLRERLTHEGCVFESTGDTAVVLEALHRWGPKKAVPLFNGMFALAYLDRRDGSLWLARDRMGIKPLVMARRGQSLLIASETKALMAHPGFGDTVRPATIPRWLGEPRVPAHLLLVPGIEELPRGSLWRCSGTDIDKSSYFDIPGSIDTARCAARGRAPASLADDFNSLIDASTLAHMTSDAPVASMCSGGVDSSLITAIAGNAQRDIPAYVADLEGTGEAEAAAVVSRHLNVELRRVPLDREGFLRLWPDAVRHADGPPVSPSDMALMAVTKAARADGIKVLLTGEGSDELFGGYDWHLATQRRWRRLEGLRGLLRSQRRRRKRRQRLEDAPFDASWPEGMYNRVLVACGGDPVPRQRELMHHLASVQPPSERALAASCLYDLHAHLRWLLHRHDRMGMAASIEMRVPFLENAIIDFAIHLPPGARIRRRQGKWLVKTVAERYLPPSVVHARKKGFPVPPAYWSGCERLLANGKLEEVLGWTCEERTALLEELARNSELSFHLVALELWLGQRLEGHTPREQVQRLLSVPV